jgi:hypothetical protein
MLNARNVRTRQHSKGLALKNLSPFKVIKSFSSKAYKLDFTDYEDMKLMYLVFHL